MKIEFSRRRVLQDVDIWRMSKQEIDIRELSKPKVLYIIDNWEKKIENAEHLGMLYFIGEEKAAT